MQDAITIFFAHPLSPRQKQYEAVRAIFVDNASYRATAKKFGYKLGALYAIIRNVRAGKLKLFPDVLKGPRQRRTPKEIQDKVIEYRENDNLSTTDIHERFKKDEVTVAVSTIERILKDGDFDKLKRRTFSERGITAKNKIIPERSEHLDFDELKPFNLDCPVAGVYFFLPYIIESGILDIVKKCKLPGSSIIGSTQACLSMLLLKLVGNERLSHMDRFDHEPALGVFAGLNVLPKTTYMNTYSCRTSEQILWNFQQELLQKFMDTFPELYGGEFINLDFHSIPHYGEKAEMEKVWCGARGKSMKGANTVFAQDSKNNVILYTRADILRKEESEEIKKFIKYWKKIKKEVSETLVFDCKFTKYSILEEITEEGIKFITLRKRNKKIIEDALDLPREEWERVRLAIPKRKYTNLLVHESEIRLTKDGDRLRQFIIRDNGRAQPTFIITNDKELLPKKVLEVYAQRWRIENKISELVAFFNLNALSSPLMIRIHFDILWTFIADTLYRRFSQDLRRFEKHNAKSIFKKFINVPGKMVYDGEKFQIRIRKRAYTPVLKSVEKLNKPFRVPWLKNRQIEIIWTA